MRGWLNLNLEKYKNTFSAFTALSKNIATLSVADVKSVNCNTFHKGRSRGASEQIRGGKRAMMEFLCHHETVFVTVTKKGRKKLLKKGVSRFTRERCNGRRSGSYFLQYRRGGCVSTI